MQDLLLRERTDAMRDVQIRIVPILESHAVVDTAHQAVSTWGTDVFRSSGFSLAGIRGWCEIRDVEGVEAYVALYPSLQRVLLDARYKIQAVFGNVECLLGLDSAGSSNGQPRLFLRIKSSASGDEAVRKLDRIDEMWWLDQPFHVRSKLTLTLA